MKKVLNVGGNSKSIALPSHYAGFEHLLLDIDPSGSPDIVCDARDLKNLGGNEFDSVYCSHNLEHYYRHDVSRVLAGFLHVLKDGGFAHIRVPDIGELIRLVVERNMDIEDVLYESKVGPITAHDVLYGHAIRIEHSGQEFFAHKTGFTNKSLVAALHAAGFSKVFSRKGRMEIDAVAFKGTPDQATRTLLEI
jgi:ubiquinone/menaquinone biosynthesis C-methylase UbiE